MGTTTRRRIASYLGAKPLWFCIVLLATCIVLVFDHSWRVCVGMAVLLLLGQLAAMEDASDDSDTEPRS